MKKQLDNAGILSELRQQSVFFRDAAKSQAPTPSPQQPVPVAANTADTAESAELHATGGVSSPAAAHERTPVQPYKRTEAQAHEGTSVPSNPRTTVPMNERPKVRAAFDVYTDQLFALKEIALKRSKSHGHRITISELVQQALETFVKRNV